MEGGRHSAPEEGLLLLFRRALAGGGVPQVFEKAEHDGRLAGAGAEARLAGLQEKRVVLQQLHQHPSTLPVTHRSRTGSATAKPSLKQHIRYFGHPLRYFLTVYKKVAVSVMQRHLVCGYLTRSLDPR